MNKHINFGCFIGILVTWRVLPLLLFSNIAIAQSISWSNSSTGLPNGFGVASIAILPSGNLLASGNIWLTTDQRLYRSTDNGASWQQVTCTGSYTSANNYFTSIVSKPDGTLFMGASSSGSSAGIYKSISLTAVVEFPEVHLSTTELFQNFPNPFNSSTTITFTLSSPGNTSLTIINILGQELITLYEGFSNPGTRILYYDASEFPSGCYFCRLRTGNNVKLIRMILLK